jgi:imidazolonepropionase-like amidohydrolase
VPRAARANPLAGSLVMAFLLAFPPAARSGDLLIRDARLIDGTGSAPRSGVSILVRDGRIAGIGPALSAPGARILDAGGATALPGLIDSHVHLSVIPGTVQRRDSAEAAAELRRAHLRGYLAAGVTTVLDTGIDVATAGDVRGWLAEGHPGPTYLTLGPALPTPGGYMAQWNPQTTVSSPAELDAAFDVIEGAGAVGVKVPIEKGFVQEIWPIHGPEMREAIAREAGERGLPIYVHASSEDEQRIGLEMGAHALVHLDFYRAPPSPEFFELVLARKAFVMTTFSIMDAELTRWHPERLDDALVEIVVPDPERRTARDPEAARFMVEEEVGMAVPWLPRWLRSPVAWWFVNEQGFHDGLASSQRAAKALYDAGVPLVVGSDAGNWPILPYQFHATSTHRELELLAEAGVPPPDVLAAATRVPARMLGRETEIGTIEVGKRADLVVVDGDPLADLRALRRIRWTVKDGLARTPQEWMTPRTQGTFHLDLNYGDSPAGGS